MSPTPAPQTTRTAYLTVDWAARSRGIGAPSSALSAKFVVKDASDVVFYAERPEGLAASSKQYQTTEGVVTGKRRIEATFYGATNAVGAIVATANATVDINGNDGTIAQSISVSKSVGSVEVTSGQRLSVGDQRFAAYTAKDASGNVVAVPPGSAFFTSDNAGIVRASNEIVEAVTSGTANITATVDGVASAPTAVSVLAPVTVTVVGNPADSVVQAVKDTLTQRKIPFVAYNDIPTPEQLQANDILMVWGSFVQDSFLGTDDAPRIEAYLATGRGVVLLNDAPAHLSGEHQWNDEEDVSTTPISRWFGGVQQMSNESRYYYRSAYIKGSLTPRFPYPATTQPETNLYEGNTNEWVIKNSDIQNPTVIRVLGRDYCDDGDYSGIMAFAYAPPTGGRVYWQFHPFGTQPANAQKITDLLIAGTNWAAGRE